MPDLARRAVLLEDPPGERRGSFGEWVSAMAAALLSLGERTTKELGRGELEQVYVKGASGYVVMMNVGEESVLEGITGHQAKLGMVLLDMKRAAADLSKIL